MTLKVFWDKYYIAIIFTIACFLMGFIILFVASPGNNNDYKTVSVNEGDSIWKIAETYSSKTKLNKMAFVKWVEEENNLVDGRVRAGDSVVIPVKATHIENDSPVQLADN